MIIPVSFRWFALAKLVVHILCLIEWFLQYAYNVTQDKAATCVSSTCFTKQSIRRLLMTGIVGEQLEAAIGNGANNCPNTSGRNFYARRSA